MKSTHTLQSPLFFFMMTGFETDCGYLGSHMNPLYSNVCTSLFRTSYFPGSEDAAFAISFELRGPRVTCGRPLWDQYISCLHDSRWKHRDSVGGTSILCLVWVVLAHALFGALLMGLLYKHVSFLVFPCVLLLQFSCEGLASWGRTPISIPCTPRGAGPIWLLGWTFILHLRQVLCSSWSLPHL